MAMTRRGFLRTSAAGLAGATTAAMTARAAEQAPVAGPSVRVAMIGCGGRGSYVMRGLIEAGAVMTHLCDLHPDRLAKCWKFLSDVQKTQPKMVADMRDVLDAQDVDAVVVTTPDHWHALATIRACQAGKDVYVEKPHSHNIWESGRMVEAARKYKRVVQVGTQNRSGAYVRAALEYVRGGKLGNIHLVKVYNLKKGEAFRLGKPNDPPKGFDWNQWLGAAVERPHNSGIFSGGWHKFWDFCGGDLTDDGIHQIDLALMLMGDPPPPTSVSCIGGRLAYPGDDAETPDVQIVTYDFGKFVMTFEQTGYPRYMEKTSATIRRNDLFPYWTQNATRIELYGSQQLMTVGRHGGGWQVMMSGGKVTDQMYGRPCDDEHYRDFLDCVRTRKAPAADIGIAHRSLLAAHMGNLALRAGNRCLRYDAKAGRFDNEDANRLIKRTYRKGFEVPEQV